jgi:hypothetical protein
MEARTNPARAHSWTPWGIGRRDVRLILVGVMAASAALVLWLGRDTTFSIDEFRIFIAGPDISLDGLLTPLNGHLILVARLAYGFVFRVLGAGYLPFRVLAVATLLLTAGLFFLFAERRVGSLVALAPTTVLLFYGSDTYHMVLGNGFIVLFAVAAGLGALLALDREDLVGDVLACLLLVIAVASYSVALPFVVGAATLILIGSDRWRRAWVFLVPTVLYSIWFIWSRGRPGGSGSSIHLHNVLLAPDWAFNSLATVGSALLGLDYDFGGFGRSSLLELDISWGPIVAVAAIAALAWRLWRGPIPRWLWALLAIPIALWLIGAAVAEPPTRTPQKSEYILPATVAVLLVTAEAARGVRFGRRVTILIFALAAVGVITNVAVLREGAERLRAESAETRADLTAVQLAGGLGLQKNASPATAFLLFSPGAARSYEQAVNRFGSPGFSLAELRAQAGAIRERVDSALANDLGLQLQSASGAVRNCHRVAGNGQDATSVRLPSGGATLVAHGPSAPVTLRRFGSTFTAAVGTLPPNQPMMLAVPRDAAPDPWYLGTPADAISACSL